jgi:hypothetical protein
MESLLRTGRIDRSKAAIRRNSGDHAATLNRAMNK